MQNLLTTAWTKLIDTCAPIKNSHGLLTGHPFSFLQATVSSGRDASRCCQCLASFRWALFPALRGCRFQLRPRLAPSTVSGKLATLCSCLPSCDGGHSPLRRSVAFFAVYPQPELRPLCNIGPVYLTACQLSFA